MIRAGKRREREREENKVNGIWKSNAVRIIQKLSTGW